MPTYVISSHGEVKWDNNAKTAVPANTTVHFYTPFGKCLSNEDGFKLQTAHCHPGAQSAQVLNQYNTVALWSGPAAKQPEIWLTPDDNGEFKSGIVRADTNQVIRSINKGQMVSLTWALQQISNDANGAQVDVYCLFCLAS